MSGRRSWIPSVSHCALSLLFIAQSVYAASRHDFPPPADPYADPKNDPYNPLRYITSNTLSAIGVGEFNRSRFVFVCTTLDYSIFDRRYCYDVICYSGIRVPDLPPLAATIIGGLLGYASNDLIADVLSFFLSPYTHGRPHTHMDDDKNRGKVHVGHGHSRLQ